MVTDEQVDRLVESVIALGNAISTVAMAVYELQQHTQEHHEVINGLARTVGTLEELMIGGPNEAQTP